MNGSAEPHGSAPDLIHPVIGFRQWRLDGLALRSLIADEAWCSPELEARCAPEQHPERPAPVNGCACGIYAWYEPCPRTASAGTAEYVAGAVVLWGRLELHGTGMRGQYARVVALALPLSRSAKRRRVLAAADALGVPAVPHRALKAVALQHGSPLPESLRPPRSWAAPAQPIGLVPRLVMSTTGSTSLRSSTSPGKEHR